MIRSQQLPDYGDIGIDLPMDGAGQRGWRKGAVSMTRPRSKKRGTRKRGSSTTILGITHRRRRRQSW